MRSTSQKILTFIPLFLSFIFVIYVAAYFDITNRTGSDILAKNGVIEYTSDDFSKDKAISLNGEWMVASDSSYTDYRTFPEAIIFGNQEVVNYELLITVPEVEEYYGIFIPSMLTGTSLYINDELMYDNIKEVKYSPRRASSVYATEHVIKVNLLIHNANNTYPSKCNHILFGTLKAIDRKNFDNNIAEFIFATICFVAFIYYLIMYIFDRARRNVLTFAILCLAVLFKTLVNNYSIMYQFLPDISLKDGLSIQQFIFPITIMAYLKFLHYYYRNYMINFLYNIIMIFAGVLALSAIIFPLSSFFILDNSFALLIVATNILVLLCGVRAVRDRKFNSHLYLIGTCFVMLASFTDIFDFYVHNLSKTYYTSGVVLFVICLTYLYIRGNTFVYNHEIALADSLSEKLSEAKREENNFLSSHLRAHFLFNALNIISGYSLFDAERAKSITSALKTYMKQLLEHDNLKELTTIRNEIELLQAFGYIEEERFPNLHITYTIPSDLPDIRVPSLILQPLLENAVNHGIRKKSSKSVGNVDIVIEVTKDFVNFSVKDNGAGVDEDILNRALSPKEKEKDKNNSLYQIQSRLKKLYNEDIIYKSVKDVGTIISFKIPIK